MSIAANLLSIIQQEMENNKAKRLIRVHVRYGSLANIVPDSFVFAFEVLTAGSPLQDATLEMVEEPLKLKCGACGIDFLAEASMVGLISPCPSCGEEFGHSVLTGRELFIDRIEVE